MKSGDGVWIKGRREIGPRSVAWAYGARVTVIYKVAVDPGPPVKVIPIYKTFDRVDLELM